MDRLKCYKNLGKDTNYRRNRRNDVVAQLRKKDREEIFMMRRNMVINSDTTSSEEDDKIKIGETIDMIQLSESICSSSILDRFDGVKIIRKVIVLDRPIIKEEISKNVKIMKKLVEFLSRSTNSKLQFDACWCLTNIAAGTTEQTNRVITAGAIPMLLELLKSKSMDICEQAVWCLGNIIGNGRTWRDYVLKYDMIKPLLSFIGKNIQKCFLRTISWVILNVCRYKDYPPPPVIIKRILSSLNYLIREKDSAILFNTVWIVSCLCDGIDQIQMVVDSDVLPTMIGFLSHREEKIQAITLRTLGKILSGSDQQTQYVINYDFIPFFPALLRHTKQRVRKDAVWCLSNILAGNQFQMQMIIDAGLIPMLIECLINETFQVQKQAAWAITNLLIRGNPQQISTVIRYGAIPPLCELLTCKNTEVIDVILECFIKLLNGKHCELASNLIDDYDGVEKIEQLQYYENKCICEKAVELYLSFPAAIRKRRN